MRGGMMAIAVLAVMAAVFALWRWWPVPSLSQAEYDAAQAEALPAPGTAPAVYFLGHSLIGRDMPSMLAAASGGKHFVAADRAALAAVQQAIANHAKSAFAEPRVLVREWFDALRAPSKEWVELDTSGHRPIFQQPGEFARAFAEKVLTAE